MLTLEQKQRWRELILDELYDRTGGDRLNGLMQPQLVEGIHRRVGSPFAAEKEFDVVEGAEDDPESQAERGDQVREVFERIEQELGKATGPDVDKQIHYLVGEGLLSWEGNQIVLTHQGVRHVEERAGAGETAA